MIVDKKSKTGDSDMLLKLSLRLIGPMLLCALLSACSPTMPEDTRRYFFPPAPVEPKVEYVKAYFSTQDLKPKKKSFVTEYILGEESPQPIFTTPVDVVSDSKGRLFVTDIGLHQVLVLDTVNFGLRTLKHSNGAAFASPFGLAIDDRGRVYVSDVTSRTISVFGPDEKFLFAVTHPDLKRPTGLAVDTENERLYVVDTPSHMIFVFDLAGNLIRVIGERGHDAGTFNFPTDVAVDVDGNLYVMDSMNARVEVFDVAGQYKRSFGERGTAEGSFAIAKNLAVSTDGHVYVTDSVEHKVVIFSLEGDLLLRIGSKSPVSGGVSPGGFYLPRGVDVDRHGAMWIVDTLNRMVHRFQYLTPEYLQEHPITKP